MALANLQLLSPLQLIVNTRRNIIGNRKTYFYFIANENYDKQSCLNPKKLWQDIYNSVRIPRTTLRIKTDEGEEVERPNKRSRENQGEC